MPALSIIAPESNQGTVERYGVAVMTRYADAYRVAKATIGFGRTIKVVGYLLAAVLLLAALIVYSQQTQVAWSEFSVLSLGLVVCAAAVGLLFFLVGTLFCAQGQLLEATLDGVVNSSPFLSNEQKASAMSLRQSSVESRPASVQFPQRPIENLKARSENPTQLTVASEPQGAAVYIDGRWKEGTPATFNLSGDGEHLVEIKVIGYKPYEQTVHCTGTPIKIDVKLEPRSTV